MGTRHVKAIIQIRRANEADQYRLDPVLRLGEPAYSLDVNKIKFGDGTTITVTPTTTYIKGSASGANVAWNSKDSVTVLKSDTDVNVTKNG